jgi:Ca-activated chloride channel family protein
MSQGKNMNYSRFIVLLVIVLSLCVLTAPNASVASLTQIPDRMVILNVRVVSASGSAVHDVSQGAFQVTEDGVPQKIELFMNDEIPLRYGLMIDSSGSLRDQFPEVMRTSALILNSNKPDDETFLVRFVSSDKIYTIQELTSDKNVLLKALDEYYIEAGQSAVIDAVYLGADYLVKKKTDGDRLRRQALVLVTDGEDRSSFYKKEQLFSLLGSNDIQIFTIGFIERLEPAKQPKAINLLKEFAADSGGRVFFPKSTLEVEHIANQIINDIRTQYVIGYVPTGVDSNKSFHKVQVTIAENPNQEKRVAVTRVGYKAQTK